MIAEAAAAAVQQVAGILVLFKTQAGHIAETVAQVLGEAAVGGVGAVGIAVIIAGVSIDRIALTEIVLEIVATMVAVDDGLDAGFEFCLSVGEGVGEVGLQGEGMGMAVTIVLLEIRAADGAIRFTQILHVVVAIVITMIGLEGGVGGPFFAGSLKGMGIVEISMAENKVVAAVGGAGAGGIKVIVLIEVAGGLGAGGRVMAEADVTREAEGIVLVHVEIQAVRIIWKGPVVTAWPCWITEELVGRSFSVVVVLETERWLWAI